MSWEISGYKSISIASFSPFFWGGGEGGEEDFGSLNFCKCSIDLDCLENALLVEFR